MNQNFPEAVPCGKSKSYLLIYFTWFQFYYSIATVDLLYSDSDHMNGFGMKLFGSEDFKSFSNFNESPQKQSKLEYLLVFSSFMSCGNFPSKFDFKINYLI